MSLSKSGICSSWAHSHTRFIICILLTLHWNTFCSSLSFPHYQFHDGVHLGLAESHLACVSPCCPNRKKQKGSLCGLSATVDFVCFFQPKISFFQSNMAAENPFFQDATHVYINAMQTCFVCSLPYGCLQKRAVSECRTWWIRIWMLATNEDQYHPAEQYPCRISKDSYTWPIPPPFHHIPPYSTGVSFGGTQDDGGGLAFDYTLFTGVTSSDHVKTQFCCGGVHLWVWQGLQFDEGTWGMTVRFVECCRNISFFHRPWLKFISFRYFCSQTWLAWKSPATTEFNNSYNSKVSKQLGYVQSCTFDLAACGIRTGFRKICIYLAGHSTSWNSRCAVTRLFFACLDAADLCRSIFHWSSSMESQDAGAPRGIIQHPRCLIFSPEWNMKSQQVAKTNLIPAANMAQLAFSARSPSILRRVPSASVGFRRLPSTGDPELGVARDVFSFSEPVRKKPSLQMASLQHLKCSPPLWCHLLTSPLVLQHSFGKWPCEFTTKG